MRASGRGSASPAVKIKDEPVDEEYDRALVPQSPPGGIKDEPDTTEVRLGLLCFHLNDALFWVSLCLPA